MLYRDFVQQVEADKINQVTLTSDRAKATVIQNGEPIVVNLPADDGLIDLLTRNEVAILIQPSPSDQTMWTRLLLSLVVPIGLLIGLLLVVILITVLVTKKFMRR